jgi:REP element-mobilizing transposase RayT
MRCTNMDEHALYEEQTGHRILSHIILCPQQRKKVLVGPVCDCSEQMAREVSGANHGQRVRRAVQPDHVHCCIQSDPETLPAAITRLMTGCSVHEVRKECPHMLTYPSLWTGRVYADTMQTGIERQGTP